VVRKIGATFRGRANLPLMESRLVDLEVRYTHLERQLGELSDIVFAQQKTIDGLLRQLAATKAQLTQLAPAITNEPPPHY